MNLHEFQAKDLFRDYGISVSKGVPIRELSEVRNAIKSLNGDKWVMKVQVHAGGRGKAGGVELVSSIEEAEAFVEKWLGKNLVTFQTDEKGQPINIILIEECSDIEEELYLGAVIDRTTQRLTFMASEEGGVNIEEIAKLENNGANTSNDLAVLAKLQQQKLKLEYRHQKLRGG